MVLPKAALKWAFRVEANSHGGHDVAGGCRIAGMLADVGDCRGHVGIVDGQDVRRMAHHDPFRRHAVAKMCAHRLPAINRSNSAAA